MGKQDRKLEGEGGSEAGSETGQEQIVLDGNIDRLFQYVRDMADYMGLCAWQIEVSIDDNISATNHRFSVGGDTVATCQVAHGTQRAHIQFWKWWSQMTPYDLRHMVTHELVHCHTMKMTWAFNNVQSITGSTGVFGVLDDAFDDMHELTVDAIAMAWAQLLPLPGDPFLTGT